MTNEIIRKRKSIRKFDMTQLDTGALEHLQVQIAQIRPLYPDIRYSIDIVSKTKGMFGIKAPHYLVFGSEDKDGAYENIGFIGQQMDLYLSESGIGSCWLGLAKPMGKDVNGLPFVISMAFGKPAGVLYRDISAFRRKSLPEISEGTDARVEAARLAPSGMNKQGWYFVADNGKIHCYRKKLHPLGRRLGCIDMGIAICHIAVESSAFCFVKEANIAEKKGFVYTGTVGGS